MMNAIKETEKYYAGSGRDFQEDMEMHLVPGSGSICLVCDEAVLLARPVNSESGVAKIVNPMHHWVRSSCDAFHVHFYAGSLSVLKGLVEAYMKSCQFVTYQRGRRGSERGGLRLRKVPITAFL